MRSLLVSVLLMGFLLPFTGNSYAMDLFNKKKKKAATEEIKPEVKKKKNKYETLMKSSGIVTAKGDFLTLHKVGQKIYIEYPLKYMERDILIGGTVSATSEPIVLSAGFKYNAPEMYRFVKRDSTIELVHPNVGATLGVDEEWAKKALETSYIDVPASRFSIHSYNTDSTAVVFEITSFLKSNKKLGPQVRSGSMSVKALSDNFQFGGVKSFEDNASIEVSQMAEAQLATMFGTISMGKMATRSVISFLLLPENKMRPRIQDSRLGIFYSMNSNERFTRPFCKISQEQDGFDTYILANRWRVEPKDLEAWKRGELVEPVKPIVWYVDDAFPAEWRGPIKAAVLNWNKAFEKIGFKNVMEARDFPKDDPSFDPDNLKYTCLRYCPNTEANAMGPSWVDPSTGEIINASVIVYNNVVQLINNWRFVQTAQIDPRVRAKKMPKDVFDESLTYVITHEIGHTLGLLHNMAASAAIPVDSLRSASFTQQYGTTPSIMDYARFNYVAQPGDKGVKLTPPELGVYDYYAIKWLYSPVPEAKDMWEEYGIVQKWLDEKAGDPFYRYGRQQMTFRIDPSALEEDLGDDPLKAGTYGIKNLKYILDHLNEWITDDPDFSHRLRLYENIQTQYSRYLTNVLYQVGGIYLSQVKDGTPGEAVQAVPRAKQKEALAWVLKELKNSSWIDRPELINATGLAVYPSAKIIATVTRELMAKPQKVILSAHVSNEKKPYTIGEFYDDLYAAAFAPTIQGKKLSFAEKMVQKNVFNAMNLIVENYVKNTRAIQSLKPSLHEMMIYGLYSEDFLNRMYDQLEEIEMANGTGAVADALLPYQFGQDANAYQSEVKVDAIDETYGYNQAMLKRVIALLKSKVASAHRDDQVHYEALISMLEAKKK